MPAKTSLPDIGSRLAAARLKRGLSQGTVARLAGFAPSYLSRIETGNVQPTFRTVLRVARVLKVTPEEIIGPESWSEDPGACPISVSGRCMLDLIRSEAQATRVASGEVYTAREVRLLQRLAVWMKDVGADRLRAMEILLDEMTNVRSDKDKVEPARKTAGRKKTRTKKA